MRVLWLCIAVTVLCAGCLPGHDGRRNTLEDSADQSGEPRVGETSEGVALEDPLWSEQAAVVARGINRFALELYAQLRGDDGNLFFSPSSVSTALAMTYGGAAGDTAREMEQTLHVRKPGDAFHDDMLALRRHWDASHQPDSIRLVAANRLWGQEGFSFLPAFLTLTREQYGAELARLDFTREEDARRSINAWVAEQTENKIEDLIPPDTLSPEVRLVLTNAIYFHGAWSAPFDADRTAVETFHVSASRTVETPMMHRSGVYGYADAGDLQVLEMTYGDGSLSMLVLLPRSVDGLSGLETQLTFENLDRWTALVREQKTEVTLPKFEMTSTFEMSQALSAMGMASAFDRRLADFSAMNGDKTLFVSAVVHKAFVDVNEEGTEAAAATGAVVAIKSLARPEQVPTFRADHPFVFLIRDNRNDAVLFVGRLQVPGAG